MARLLLVDDDTLVLSALRDFLQRGGHEVRAMYSSTAAARLLEQERFDVIVADYMMPVMKGDEIVRIARLHNPTACIFVLSGMPVPEAMEGACDKLAKPGDVPSILRRIAECPNRGGLGRDVVCAYCKRG